MHPILTLDRAGWTYSTTMGHSLHHATGLKLDLTPTQGQGTAVVDRSIQKNNPYVLQFPLQLPSSPDWPEVFWSEVDRVAGAQAVAEFQAMYDALTRIFVQEGIAGHMKLQRHPRPNRFSLIRHDDTQVFTGQVAPFGARQAEIDALLSHVRHVCVPGYLGAPKPSGHWTPWGWVFWDLSWTQHERMEILAAAQDA